MLQVSYSNAVGSLMYTMMCTRPEILLVVGIISMYMHNPDKEHWQAVKWILTYNKHVYSTVYSCIVDHRG